MERKSKISKEQHYNNYLNNINKWSNIYCTFENNWIKNYEVPLASINKAMQAWQETFSTNNSIRQFIDYSQNIHNFLSNNNNFMQINNALKALQDSFAMNDYFKELSAQQEAISKMFSSSAIRDLALYQQKIIDKLENFEIEQENAKEFIEEISQNNIEEQFEIIKSETNGKVKDYLKKNHLTILSILIPIILFIWQTCNNTVVEQNNKMILLLEQSNKVQQELLETNKQILSEEQLQTELIITQTELLKELIADIKINVASKNKEE